MLENAPYENEEDHAFNEFAFWRRPISVLNLNEGSGTDEEFHYWHRRPSNLVGSFFDRSGEATVLLRIGACATLLRGQTTLSTPPHATHNADQEQPAIARPEPADVLSSL